MGLLDIEISATDEEVESFYKNVGANVKRLRKEKSVSQLELALVIGHKSAAFLANAENCARGQHLNLEHLFKISKALDIDMSEFFKESGCRQSSY